VGAAWPDFAAFRGFALGLQSAIESEARKSDAIGLACSGAPNEAASPQALAFCRSLLRKTCIFHTLKHTFHLYCNEV
jgi:hypothetical protein